MIFGDPSQPWRRTSSPPPPPSPSPPLSKQVRQQQQQRYHHTPRQVLAQFPFLQVTMQFLAVDSAAAEHSKSLWWWRRVAKMFGSRVGSVACRGRNCHAEYIEVVAVEVHAACWRALMRTTSKTNLTTAEALTADEQFASEKLLNLKSIQRICHDLNPQW